MLKKIFLIIRKILTIGILLTLFTTSTMAFAESKTAANTASANANNNHITVLKKEATIQKDEGANDDIVTVTTQATPESAVEKRSEKESIIPPNYFAITFYKPNYVLPFYYTGSPYNKVYQNTTPGNEQIKNTEVKFQLSLKVPIWKCIFNRPSNLYFAYTQLSYWQAYNRTAFFRETDYEPEFFLANEINFHLFKKWTINFINIGVVHQSNGFGDSAERSWNRVYLEAITSNDVLMFSIKPWYVIHDSTYNHQNPNMANYLGYGEITLAYKIGKHVLSLQAHSLFEQGGRHLTGIFGWSFPLTPYLYGYVQVFSGYGQSLIEYDHRTNSFGLGLALNNWI